MQDHVVPRFHLDHDETIDGNVTRSDVHPTAPHDSMAISRSDSMGLPWQISEVVCFFWCVFFHNFFLIPEK